MSAGSSMQGDLSLGKDLTLGIEAVEDECLTELLAAMHIASIRWNPLISALFSSLYHSCSTDAACCDLCPHQDAALGSSAYWALLRQRFIQCNCTARAQAYRWLLWQNDTPGGRVYFLGGWGISCPGSCAHRPDKWGQRGEAPRAQLHGYTPISPC